MRNLFLSAFCCLFFSACERAPSIQTLTGYAQGTTYSVKYWTTQSIDSKALQNAINNELARIDKLMSNYRKDSVIEHFNQQNVVNQPLNIDREILEILNISNEVYEKSKHCYDPTIKPLFQIWGFSDDKLSIPDDNTIAQTLARIGFKYLQRGSTTLTKTVPGLTVDLSAIGQGYAVAKIAQLLEQHGITNYLTEIGGEMLVAGNKPNNEKWRVGIERPIPNSQKISEIITLSGQQKVAIMTSGTYRHYYDDNGKQYSHILDPRSGKPVAHNSVAVTVLLNNATYADAWSTALLCLGSQVGLAVANQEHIPAIFYDIDADKQIKRLPSQATQQQNDWQITDN